MNDFEKNKKSSGLWIVRQDGHMHSCFWLAVFAVAFTVFLTLDPQIVLMDIWSELRAHSPLLGMLGILCLIAVSLVWSAGQRIDAWVFSYFNSYGRRPGWLDKIVQMLTEFGSGIVTFSIALILFLNGNSLLAYEFLFGTLTLWLTVEIIKALIRRERPFTKIKGVRIVGKRARGKSFPSGHTSQAFYIATVIIQYLGGGWIAAIFLYLAALLVGATRMYLGMHYPRDVLAGAILGASWGMIGVIINSTIFG